MKPKKRVAIAPRPRVYCASSLIHARMWTQWTDALHPNIRIVSSWHSSDTLLADDTNELTASQAWRQNLREIAYDADHLLLYATAADILQGALVEVGVALAHHVKVHLVGDYPWRSWQYASSFITRHPTLHDALLDITRPTELAERSAKRRAEDGTET